VDGGADDRLHTAKTLARITKSTGRIKCHQLSGDLMF
jgi:hypothetical protein